MSINLGLKRISRLLNYIGNPQEKLRVLHVAGTNGKGSVCTYLASILQQQKSASVGKFTTPHLIHVTDSITINSEPIPSHVYKEKRIALDSLNKDYDLNCTEFELLTCTALQYFSESNCDWCVIEVGLGGRLDATNIIPGRCKLACGITKLGLDHEAFLGNSLTEIAYQKAGIITKGVSFTAVDGSNDDDTIAEIKKQSDKMDCELHITDPSFPGDSVETKSWGIIKPEKLPLNGSYQICNLRVALSILDHLKQKGILSLTKNDIYSGLKSVSWAGRLQELDYCYDAETKSTIPLLLDGAHNGVAAVELAKFLRAKYGDIPLTFVVAVTEGKDLNSLLQPLVRKEDKVIATEFDKVDGMPWIRSFRSETLAKYIRERLTTKVKVQPALHTVIPALAADQENASGPIIVCGSLYLCGELLGIHKRNI